jgi:predicted anti-sigma-YlaC factor YlaD
MLPKTAYKEKIAMLKRAKRFYLRGQGLVMRALEVKYPGFLQLIHSPKPETALDKCDKDTVGFLYWACAGMFAAYSTDVFDIKLSVELAPLALLMQRALILDESFNSGAIHDFFISYYASMPKGLGGDDEKARQHFERAIEISGGLNPSPYVTYATTICIKNQDAAKFEELLRKALSIDPDKNQAMRLAVIVAQRKARWYLDHRDDFFI